MSPSKMGGAGSREVYWHPVSPFSRPVILLLKVTGCKCKDHIVDLASGEQRSEAFGMLNPKHQVPVLVEGNFVLTESVAILKYLTAMPKIRDNWYPLNSYSRARVDEILMWFLTGPITENNLFVPIVVQGHLQNQPVNEALVNERAAKLHDALDFVERNYLKTRKFLAGSDISIADISVACYLTQMEAVGMQLGRNRPLLEAWYARVKAKCKGHYEELHKPVFEFASFWNRKY